jgi:hypothetical protein
MVTAYQGTIQNGQIRLDDTPELPEGAQVILVVVKGAQQAGEGAPLTLGDLLETPLVGMWADREDIVDSAEFARQLRERLARREQ